MAVALTLGGGCGDDDGGDNANQSWLDGGQGDAATLGDGGVDGGGQTDAQSGDCDSPTSGEVGEPNPAQGQVGHTEAAHWRFNRFAALTISFDDSTPGQANHGVPAMIARGLTGTWFVNPGTDPYQAYLDVWEVDAPQNGQELANHSMHHSGAADYAEAEAEIGDAAQIIWSVYPPERSRLHGFNNGGGTDWNVTASEYETLLDQYHCVERLHSTGIASATLAADLFPQIRDRLMLDPSAGGWADGWGLIHFHGLCDPVVNDNGHCICTPANPCEEWGGGVLSAAVELGEFTTFLDGLVTDNWVVDNVWIDGFIAVYKYQQLRDDASFLFVPLPQNEDELAIRLVSIQGLDPTFYDEELTLITIAPPTWTTCVAVQCGQILACEVVDGSAVYGARLGHGDIGLSGN